MQQKNRSVEHTTSIHSGAVHKCQLPFFGMDIFDDINPSSQGTEDDEEE